MPGIRSGAIGAGAWLAGLPWRLKPGRGKPLTTDDPRLKRILVIKPCCMGDVLMATPAIAALRKALPGAHFAFTVGQWSRLAIANNPKIDAIVETTISAQHPSLAEHRSLARILKQGRYGAALVLDRSPLLNLVPYMAGVPVRAGLDSANRGLALTHPVLCPGSTRRHEVEWYLDVVRALGLSVDSELAYLEFYPTEEERAEGGRVLSEVGEESENGFVAIHLGGGANPGMSLPSKRWQPERWARIADWLAETYEPNILLLGGPGKEDREAADSLKAALFPTTRPYVVDLVGRLEWGAMGAVIERCGLFMGHDTGAMHLATAVYTPVVAVFGPSDPARYGPWDLSKRSAVVAPKQAVSDAESLRKASMSGERYNTAVSVEEVWAAVERVYGGILSRERVGA
ncbi:MAG TPA: glycosyltransferase family 9 protein [Chloroflexia bacterium]|nr:glycosyltransferase family 9 protein [Chloroflexia bacterium]